MFDVDSWYPINSAVITYFYLSPVVDGWYPIDNAVIT
jgi:hypothetical protein